MCSDHGKRDILEVTGVGVASKEAAGGREGILREIFGGRAASGGIATEMRETLGKGFWNGLLGIMHCGDPFATSPKDHLC